MASAIQVVGLVAFLAFLVIVVVLIAISLLKPKRARPDDDHTGYHLEPPLDGGGGSD